MPVALVAAIGVAAVTVISAASSDGRGHGIVGQVFSEGDDESDDAECDRDKGYGDRSGRLAALAELVGTDSEGLKTALGEGQTLAQIAEANGVEVQDVIDALVAKVNERIDSAVEAGKLSVEEGETKKAAAASRIEEVVNDGFEGKPFRSWGKGRWGGQGIGGSSLGGSAVDG